MLTPKDRNTKRLLPISQEGGNNRGKKNGKKEEETKDLQEQMDAG